MVGSTDGTMTGELAWKERLLGGTMASGGGMSGFFPAPAYQNRLAPPDATGTWIHGDTKAFRGRWTPDVAASASFTSGIAIRLAGMPFVGGGTSAATPLWAALVTCLAVRIGRPCGWLTPVLYGLAGTPSLRSIGGADNDLSVEPSSQPHYRAREGWDPCTGLGVPDGRALLEALRAGSDQGP
jgi:kumamolisin